MSTSVFPGPPAAVIPDPLDVLIAEEDHIERLKAALSAMTPIEQQVLLRRVCAGHPFSRIATALSITRGEVQQAYERAWKRVDSLRTA
jgi:DNA-directed RNA polymerase specialized sigma24 family protein